MLEELPAEARAESVAWFIQLGKYQNKIGWGYGDFLADVAVRVSRGKTKSARAVGQHAV